MKKTLFLFALLLSIFLVFKDSKGIVNNLNHSLTCPTSDLPCCNNGYIPGVSQFGLCCINENGDMVEIAISGSCCQHLWYINGNNPPSPYAQCKQCRD